MAFSNLTKHLILALFSCNIYVSFLAIDSQENGKQNAAEEEKEEEAPALLSPLLLCLLPLRLPACFAWCAFLLRLVLQSLLACLRTRER